MRLFQTSEFDDRAEFTKQQKLIADILHDWDPIGVFDNPIFSQDPTEYDDLVSPLSVVLERGVTVAALAAELDEVMTKDYRMLNVDTEEVAAKLLAAWTAPSCQSPTARGSGGI
ncbi:hypothetical protein AX769_22250 (plasmid) [Frondihabitans sp. PAMC 28766]|uniref:hypothetical protein n=1 Tax=Frondihabitans sp. PAMC 28766 TaxID=1795630 RepID=UPI00078DCE2A|nr:hypothetical protein [Frondihabitans sp. PAMC 28766]AMM22853.1 hypothetical protein AX769_22250 [Frondihabitans sp. PAMC 28766]